MPQAKQSRIKQKLPQCIHTFHSDKLRKHTQNTRPKYPALLANSPCTASPRTKPRVMVQSLIVKSYLNFSRGGGSVPDSEVAVTPASLSDGDAPGGGRLRDPASPRARGGSCQ